MSKQQDELFKGSVMTFGQHLNELRAALWRSVLGLAIGVVLGFFLANSIVRLIQSPMENALQEYYLDVAKEDLHQINPNISEAETQKAFDQRMVYQRVYVDSDELSKALNGQGHALSAQSRDRQPLAATRRSVSTKNWRQPRSRRRGINSKRHPNSVCFTEQAPRAPPLASHR